jgi:hypothetical protein
MAHTSNPSDSEGRDQEDRGSKPARGKSHLPQTPFTKIGLVEWLKVKSLSSSPSTAKANKQINK